MINITNTKSKCCEDISLIENYNIAINDTSQVWACHHRLETHTSNGDRRLVDITVDELIALDMYYNRPASELIFMTKSEHSKLHTIGHHRNAGRVLSEDTKAKLSIALRGNKNGLGHKGNSQLGRKRSNETLSKMSESMKKYWESERSIEERKRKSEALKGRWKGMSWKVVDGKRVWYNKEDK